MKPLLAIVLVTASASAIRAQIAATPGQSKAGVAEVRARNVGTVAVTAVAIPDQPVGAPFRPSAFVEEQVKILHTERVALLASHPLLATAMLSRTQQPGP